VRHLSAALFALALLLRLAFVTTQPHVPPWGDIVAYSGIATGMGHFFFAGRSQRPRRDLPRRNQAMARRSG
jgi:hypothetical protein